MSNYTTSRNLSRPPLKTIPTNSLSNNLTITNDSNLIQVPTHNITPDLTNNQNQENNTLNTTQDNTSTLSTSNTNITQLF